MLPVRLMCLNYTQSYLFTALSGSWCVPPLYLSVLLITSTLSPFTVFIWLTEILSPAVCDRQTDSISASRIAPRAESWITLSWPCGLGRRHALNHILSYRLCLPNLCHVTWEAAECVSSACLRYTTYNPASFILCSLCSCKQRQSLHEHTSL